MASPRTVPNGSLTIRMGMLTMPVTIGKSWADEREKNLRELCSCCNLPVDRTERCPTKGGPPSGKVKGVEMADGTWHILSADEISFIESVKSKTLSIEETAPLSRLPMLFATGTYYVRHDDKRGEGQEEIFATFAAGLEKSRTGAIVKWGSTSRERLCVMHAHNGIVFLTTIPMLAELRLPGAQEKAHLTATVNNKTVDTMVELFDAMGVAKFDHGSYTDEGLSKRNAVVDAILDGEVPEKNSKDEKPMFGALDLIATLNAEIAAKKEK